MLRGAVVLEIAEHLHGTVIEATSVLDLGSSRLHVWGYQTPSGQRAIVIQQMEQRFVRWRDFPGSVMEAEAYYRTQAAAPVDTQRAAA